MFILKKIGNFIAVFSTALAVFTIGSILTQCYYCPKAYAQTTQTDSSMVFSGFSSNVYMDYTRRQARYWSAGTLLHSNLGMVANQGSTSRSAKDIWAVAIAGAYRRAAVYFKNTVRQKGPYAIIINGTKYFFVSCIYYTNSFLCYTSSDLPNLPTLGNTENKTLNINVAYAGDVGISWRITAYGEAGNLSEGYVGNRINVPNANFFFTIDPIDNYEIYNSSSNFSTYYRTSPSHIINGQTRPTYSDIPDFENWDDETNTQHQRYIGRSYRINIIKANGEPLYGSTSYEFSASPPPDLTNLDTYVHIFNGTRPLQELWLEREGGALPRNITFPAVGSGSTAFYLTALQATENLVNLAFYPSTYTSNSSYQNTYQPRFLKTLLRLKTLLAIEIGGTSYNLSYFSEGSNPSSSFFSSSVVANSADRVTASDLTKSINFEMVDNEEVDFTEQAIQNFRSSGGTGLNYYALILRTTGSSGSSLSGFTIPLNTYVFQSSFSKTTTHIVINGREYPVTASPSHNIVSNGITYKLYYSEAITTAEFRPARRSLNFGLNFKFSDGTYWNNTRSKLFNRVSSLKIWENTDPPNILTFTALPATIDLDTRSTGNIALSWTATAQTGKTQNSQCWLEPQGTKVGQSYVTGSGTGVSETFNTPQPNQTQTYRVVVMNDGGASHRDATVTITQNAVLSNLSVASTPSQPGRVGGITIRMRGRVKGYPRPSISINQGWSSPLTDRHFTAVAGQINTWDFETTHFFGTDRTIAFIVTATNSSGSVTGNITYTPQ